MHWENQISSKVYFIILFIDKGTICLRLSINRSKPKLKWHCDFIYRVALWSWMIWLNKDGWSGFKKLLIRIRRQFILFVKEVICTIRFLKADDPTSRSKWSRSSALRSKWSGWSASWSQMIQLWEIRSFLLKNCFLYFGYNLEGWYHWYVSKVS